MAAKQELQVAVLIERTAQPNRWEDWGFRLVDVVPQEPAFGTERRVLREDQGRVLWLFPDFTVALHRDDGEGYYLNLSSGAPVWFVMWRVDDEDPSRAAPHAVSVSYHDAGRWLDAQERVDNVPLPTEVCAWVQAFVDEHHKPEPKKRRRPVSFQAPQDREPPRGQGHE